MTNGVKTTNLTRQFAIDEVIGNVTTEGVASTVRIPFSALADQLAGTGAFVFGNAVYAANEADLIAATPPSATAGGIVLDDPDPTKNGYWVQDDAAPSGWTWERGFRQTFGEFTNWGGTANAQTAELESWVSPSEVRVYFGQPAQDNTGPLTLNGTPVVNAAGNALSAGEWTGTILFIENSNGDYQLIIDAGAAAAAAQSATAAAASLAEFNEKYLGAFADDASATAAAGGAPVTGALYWNTTDGILKTWDGAAWGASTAAIPDGAITNAKVSASAGIQASKLSYLSSATDAQQTTVQAWLDRIKFVEDFGSITYGTVASNGVPVKNSGADCSLVVQRALDWLEEAGGTLMFRGDKVYRIDDPLTLLNPTGIQNGRFYNVEFCGAILDFQNLTGSEVGITLGASGASGMLANGGFRLANVQAFGPEFDGWNQDTGGTAGTTTRFLFQQYAGHVTLDNVGGHYFYIGEEVFYSFPAIKTVNFDRNRIGSYLREAANAQVYLKMDNSACGLGLQIVAPSVGAVGDGKINNIEAVSYRFENCTNGGVIDPGNSASTVLISNLRFKSGYNNAVTYDVWRIGMHYEAATPATRSAGGEVVGQVADVEIIGGIQNHTFDADTAFIAYQSNGNARQISVKADVPFNTNAFVNAPFGGHYLLGDGNAFTEVLYDSSGNEVRQISPDGLTRSRVGGTEVAFYYPKGSATLVGTVVTSAGATAYNTSSDSNIKDDRGLVAPAAARDVLRLMAVHEYTLKDKSSDSIFWGFFAQELHELVPQAVTPGSPPELFGTDGYVQWGVDLSKLVPYLVGGWQDLDRRLQALEAAI